MIKVCTVIGTRPEAIKMAMLIKKLSAHPDIEHSLIVTGQHREMLDQVLDFFELKADADLNIMQSGQQLSDVTSRILDSITPVLVNLKPSIVLVHGDTNTSFAAALAAFYLQIPVGHVEAGLRTFNLKAPFPEEANRVMTDKISFAHFAPTKLNEQHLLNDGIQPEQIFITGNTVIDSLLFAKDHVNGFSHHIQLPALRNLKVTDRIILITGHRRENFGEGFMEICNAINELAISHPEIKFVYPVHLNPSVRKPVIQLLGAQKNIILCEPMNYPDFVYLMKIAWIILTDSGGIQEEGPGLGKPVLVMREVTERPEAIEAGTVKLVGANAEQIISNVNQLIADASLYKKMSAAHNPYGDGKASDRITDWLINNQDRIKKHIE